MNWGYWGSVGVVTSKAYQDRMAQAGVGSIEPPEAMETLEALLAGPMDQIALIKTTKPPAMDLINSQEQIRLYPEIGHSHIQSIKNSAPVQVSQVQPLQSKTISSARDIDVLLCRLLLGQLQAIGLFSGKEPMTPDLRKKVVDPLYYRWLAESLSVLTRKRLLTCEQEIYTAADPVPIDIEAAWKQWDATVQSWLADPDTKAQVTLIDATLRALPGILTGKTPATDIMFPHSSMELVEGVYSNNPISNYFNEILADILISYIATRLDRDPS